MRIERIHIDGFGHYRDERFGPFSPGVNVMCGPNGSGKSTVHRFIQAVLFGFPKAKSSEWLPALAGGRHGGRVILVDGEGGRVIVERHSDLPGARVTLPDGALVGDDDLRPLLGGATPDIFQSIFALDLDELRPLDRLSAEELSSRIYGAGMGAEKLPEVVAAFETVARKIFTPTGRAQYVPKTIAALKDVETRLAAIRAEASEFHSLRGERDGIAGRVENLDRQLAELRERHRACTGWLSGLQRREQTLADAESALVTVAGGETVDGPLLAIDTGDISQVRQEALGFQARLNEAAWRGRDAEVEVEERRRNLDEAERRVRALGAALVERPAGDDIAALQRAVDDLRESWARFETATRIAHAAGAVRAPARSDAPGSGILLLLAAGGSAAAGVVAGGPLAIGGFVVAAILLVVAIVLMAKSGGQPPMSRQPALPADEVRRAERAFAGAAMAAGVSPELGRDAIVEAERLLALAREQHRIREEHRQATAVAAGHQAALSDALQARHAARVAREAVEDEWRAWLAEKGLPPDRLPDSVLSLIDEADATRAARAEVRRARLALDELLAEAEAVLGSTPTAASLQEASARFEREIRETEEARSELLRRRGELDGRLSRLATDTTGAQLRAEHAGLLTDLQDDVREWSVLKLANAVLEHARKRYEEERQPAVVQAASDVFHWITGGAYERVIVPAKGHGDVSVITSGGERLRASQLSRGTREQLYLAIRFGYIREFGKQACPLPVLVDDILVNFDPRRAAAAVDALGQLSAFHQVIVFTCHDAMADLIHSRVPDSAMFHLAVASQLEA